LAYVVLSFGGPTYVWLEDVLGKEGSVNARVFVGFKVDEGFFRNAFVGGSTYELTSVSKHKNKEKVERKGRRGSG